MTFPVQTVRVPYSKKLERFFRYHGCKKCCHADTIHPLRGIRMGQIMDETVQREQDLKDAGYQVVSIWEHAYDERIRHDADFREFCKSFYVLEPLNPRAAFYGGRTNAVKLHHKVVDDEEIRYYDVCRYSMADWSKTYVLLGTLTPDFDF